MRNILLILSIFIYACSTSSSENKQSNSLTNDSEKEAVISLEKFNSSVESNKNDSLNKAFRNFTDYEKKLDFVQQTKVLDSVILLNHYKNYKDVYTDYCYSFIDFTLDSDFHNHHKRGNFQEETYISVKEDQLASLPVSYLTDDISKNWSELFKYKDLMISSSNRLRDVRMDSCFYKIRYMDGFFAKPIRSITNGTNKVELLLYNENSITTKIYDSLNVHFVNKSKSVAIFQYVNYNYKKETYFTAYQLYATADYCKKLAVLARIESEYDLCEDMGIEYNIDWGEYITKLDSLNILIGNSRIE